MTEREIIDSVTSIYTADGRSWEVKVGTLNYVNTKQGGSYVFVDPSISNHHVTLYEEHVVALVRRPADGK